MTACLTDPDDNQRMLFGLLGMISPSASAVCGAVDACRSIHGAQARPVAPAEAAAGTAADGGGDGANANAEIRVLVRVAVRPPYPLCFILGTAWS